MYFAVALGYMTMFWAILQMVYLSLLWKQLRYQVSLFFSPVGNILFSFKVSVMFGGFFLTVACCNINTIYNIVSFSLRTCFRVLCSTLFLGALLPNPVFLGISGAGWSPISGLWTCVCYIVFLCLSIPVEDGPVCSVSQMTWSLKILRVFHVLD